MLEPKYVDYKDLLLDPNNPRLALSFTDREETLDEDIVAAQEALEELFGIPPNRDEQRDLDRLIGDSVEHTSDDFFSIKDLMDSMKQIGFVGIQNIIVREINDSGKYVVIEGNRRVASIKTVMRAHETSLPGSQDEIQDEANLESLQRIQVMVLQTKNLQPDEVDKLISTTLGLRHYGSQLKWDLLPRAKNICDEYVKIAPEPFAYTSENGLYVADLLAIGAAEVKKLLRGYICYKQLSDMYRVKPHHFSLILAGIENAKLTTHEYFRLHEKTFQLLADTAHRLDQVCEFRDRDRAGFEKTISDPKEFKKLGSILGDSHRHKSDTIRNYAQGLFAEVIQKQIPLDDAYTDLVAFKKRHQWVQALRSLLERQENDENLSPDKFIDEGQELKVRDDLRVLLKRFLAVLEI